MVRAMEVGIPGFKSETGRPLGGGKGGAFPPFRKGCGRMGRPAGGSIVPRSPKARDRGRPAARARMDGRGWV